MGIKGKPQPVAKQIEPGTVIKGGQNVVYQVSERPPAPQPLKPSTANPESKTAGSSG